jgi:competence protein ComEC
VTELPRIPAPHFLVGALCIGFAVSLFIPQDFPLVGVTACGFALLGVASAGRRAVLLGASMLLLGLWWGSLRLADLERSTLVHEAGTAALARLEVTGPARTSPFAIRVPVRVQRWDGRPVDEAARLQLPLGRAPPQGVVLELVASAERPPAAEPGDEFDERGFLARQGVHVVLRADSFRVVGERGGIGGVADDFRAAIARTMAPGLEGERRSVIAGIVLGEDEGLDPELRDSFRASGLYHLLAVSGQNVAYVVAGALLLAWLIGLPRWAGHVAALSCIVGYVLAVGWQPSVVRAGVAGALASLAWLAARPSDRWYFFLVGAALLLAVNPHALLEPGFQLSFAAVAAIFVAVPRLERRLEGYPLPRRLVAVVAVSSGCGLATAPILWLHFGAVPLYSVLANAMAEPVVAPLLGFALACSALEPLTPAAALSLAWVNGWLATYVAWCARAVGGLPGAQVGSGVAVASLAVGAFFILVLVRLPRRARFRVAAAVAIAAALAAGGRLAWGTSAPPPPEDLRITVLDVGQGDAILLQVREGAILVDQGPPEAEVAEQLEGLGLERLAAVVLTHPHRDHVGGAAEVLDEVEVGALLSPLQPTDSPDERAALAEARAEAVPIVAARAGASYRIGRMRIRILWPDVAGTEDEDPHAHGAVVLASYGSFDALLTGDSESEVTLPLRPPPVELLKVAHHGSADPGLPALLALVQPRLAVISVGAENDYGHPTPETLSALAEVPRLETWRTDEHGEIVVESDGTTFSVRAER